MSHRLPVARDELRAAAVGGRIFILNGHAGPLEAGLGSVSEVDVYDPAERTYSGIRHSDRARPLRGGVVSRRRLPGRRRLERTAVGRAVAVLPGRGASGRSCRRWRRLAPATPRSVIGDRLYVVGGTHGQRLHRSRASFAHVARDLRLPDRRVERRPRHADRAPPLRRRRWWTGSSTPSGEGRPATSRSTPSSASTRRQRRVGGARPAAAGSRRRGRRGGREEGSWWSAVATISRGG